MSRKFDLTMPIDERTPVFPGDPEQEIEQIAQVEEDGWTEKRLTFNSHFSTHIDAPIHMKSGGKTLDDFEIDRFIGEAVVIDASDQKEIEPSLEKVQEDDIVFFYTGHIEKAYDEDFFEDNPVITEETAEKLIEKGVSIVGLDSYTPDNDPFPVHKKFFAEEILIVENLVNLEKLIGERFECYILPLKIGDADGAPCRVLAELD
jgi:arylformamidase